MEAKVIYTQRMLPVRAVLIKELTYFYWEDKITVPAGTEVLVDVINRYVLIGKHHTTIEDHEWVELFQN